MSGNGYETAHWIVKPVDIEDGAGRTVARFSVESRDGGRARGLFLRRVDAVACAKVWELMGWRGDSKDEQAE